jgi:hypothetical protein
MDVATLLESVNSALLARDWNAARAWLITAEALVADHVAWKVPRRFVTTSTGYNEWCLQLARLRLEIQTDNVSAAACHLDALLRQGSLHRDILLHIAVDVVHAALDPSPTTATHCNRLWQRKAPIKK